MKIFGEKKGGSDFSHGLRVPSIFRIRIVLKYNSLILLGF